METQIQKNVPIPPTQSYSRKKKYPMEELDIEDSFFVPEGNRNTMYSASARIKKKYPGRQFRIATVIEDGIEGLRVWRKEDETEQ